MLQIFFWGEGEIMIFTNIKYGIVDFGADLDRTG